MDVNDDSVVLEIEESNDREHIDDEDFDGDCCFQIIKSLKGVSLGRQLKREVFKLGVAHLTWGIIIFILSIYESLAFMITTFFTNITYGSSILTLQYSISVFAILAGVISMLVMRYWASLCTNRSLLQNLMRGYEIILVLFVILNITLYAKIIMTFKNETFQVFIINIGIHY